MENEQAAKNLPCLAPEERIPELERELAPWSCRPSPVILEFPGETWDHAIHRTAPGASAALVDAAAFPGTDELLDCLSQVFRILPVLVIAENPAEEARILAALAASCPACAFELCRRDLLAEQAGPRLGILAARTAAEKESAGRRRDGLTGLGTRVGLRDALERDLTAPPAGTTGFFILDIDHFKFVNDTHGHAAGDEVLRRSAERLLLIPELSDRAFRLGGDEFAGIISGRERAEIVRVLEDLREAIAGQTIEWEGTEIRVTASVGFTFLEPDMTTEDAFHRADIALYSAKAAGRNRVQCHDLCWDAAEEDPGRAAVDHFENVTRVWTDRISELIRSVGRKAMEEARRGADTDGLTGLNNRAYYDRRITRDLENALRIGTPLSLVLFDVDDFHGVNMEYGYPSGDKALAKVAELARNHARITDWSARYGGEEFVIVLPGADGEAAGFVAERFRLALQAQRFTHWTAARYR